jgi:hypothetical protein
VIFPSARTGEFTQRTPSPGVARDSARRKAMGGPAIGLRKMPNRGRASLSFAVRAKRSKSPDQTEGRSQARGLRAPPSRARDLNASRFSEERQPRDVSCSLRYRLTPFQLRLTLRWVSDRPTSPSLLSRRLPFDHSGAGSGYDGPAGAASAACRIARALPDGQRATVQF